MVEFFGGFAITIVAFILCLSIIVFIHEFGHYFIGKICGIHAEVFSLGFGPVLFSTFDKRGTKWQVAAIPLGGYVKFLGDKNEKSISFHSDGENGRHSIHGAPLWARFLTVAAGPIFNFLFSIILFFFIFINQGTTKYPLEVQKLFDLPYDQKLKEGDIIISINHVMAEPDLSIFVKKVEESSSGNFVTYTVERNKAIVELYNVNQNPPLISQVLPQSSAITAGLKKGDIIVSINSELINNFGQIKRFVESSNGQALSVQYIRNGLPYVTEVTPLDIDVPQPNGGFERVYRIGIVGEYFPFMPATEITPPLEAALKAGKSTYLVLEGSVKGLFHIIFGNISSCNLSGPISIAETSGQMAKQGGVNFLWFIGVLSAAIGMINLFPIPVLDGGHLLFFIFEAVLGKKPNPAAMNSFMTIGFFVLVSLMLFSLINDLFCP